MIALSELRAARSRIEPYTVTTPVDASASISSQLGVTVALKLELLQKTGSFKPRGAINQVMSLPPGRLGVGVVGVSGGNFAQALAFTAGVLGVRARIVMPESTPANYVEATRGYGAEVEFVADVGEAFARADEHAEEGWAVAHPFDHPAMMAGNGVVGLELVEQVPDMTDLFVSVGGGGLIAGVASAVLAIKPDVRIWPVETEGADALALSLAAGHPVEIAPTSIAKTLGSPYAAAMAIELARERFAEVVVVSDAEAVAAMRFLYERAKLATEPAAACTLAAARRVRDRLDPAGRTVLLLCGGNVAATDFCRWMAEYDSA